MGGTRLALVSFFRNIGSPRNALKGVKAQQILQFVRLQVTALVIFILLSLFASFGHVLNIAFVIVAWNLARLCVKYLYDFLPKSTITTLHDKAVFITGCDTGFGNELARKLDKKGVTVFAGCLFSEGPDALKLKQECTDKLHLVQMDVTKDDDVREAVEMVQKKLDGEKLWAIVNNAGIAILGEAEYMSIESYKKVMEVNVFGVARVTQAFLPLLRHSRGRVVIVASQASHICVPTSTAYSMSKSAVYSYAEGLRRELMRWNVSVHILEPWLYRTGITSTKVITDNLHREWDNAPEEVRTAYGGDRYIKQFKGIYGFTKGVSTTGSNISEVVDCMEDAVIGEDPQLIYLPGKSGKFFSWLATGFPKELVDLICYAGMPFTGDYRRKEYKKG